MAWVSLRRPSSIVASCGVNAASTSAAPPHRLAVASITAARSPGARWASSSGEPRAQRRPRRACAVAAAIEVGRDRAPGRRGCERRRDRPRHRRRRDGPAAIASIIASRRAGSSSAIRASLSSVARPVRRSRRARAAARPRDRCAASSSRARVRASPLARCQAQERVAQLEIRRLVGLAHLATALDERRARQPIGEPRREPRVPRRPLRIADDRIDRAGDRERTERARRRRACRRARRSSASASAGAAARRA